MIKYNLEGLDKSLKGLDKLCVKLETNAARGLQKALFFLEKKSKRILHKGYGLKTGTMKRSIKGRVLEQKKDIVRGALGANTEYAAIQELGSAKNPKRKAKPYLWPAVEKNLENIEKIMAEEIKKII